MLKNIFLLGDHSLGISGSFYIVNADICALQDSNEKRVVIVFPCKVVKNKGGYSLQFPKGIVYFELLNPDVCLIQNLKFKKFSIKQIGVGRNNISH